MTKKLLTKEMVAQAKQELEIDGEKVTSKSVRDRIGFGSYTTAKDLLEELQAEETALEPAPEEIAAALSGAADKIWATAREKAAEAFQAQKALLKARAEDARALAAERLDVIADLEETQATLEAENTKIRKAILEAETLSKKMRSRLAELDKELAMEKTRNVTLQRLLESAFGKSGHV